MSSPMRPNFSAEMQSPFDYNYNGQIPKTPEHHQDLPSVLDQQPPPPPRQTFKLRRKRVSVPFQEPEVVSSDTVIPTIEMSEAVSEMSSPMLHPTPTHGLLVPLPSIQRLVTPPKTPSSRTAHNVFGSHTPNSTNEWSLINDSRDRQGFERAGSICSSFSDSSISSCGSSAFSAPNGSCTSPDYETIDPFVEDGSPSKAGPFVFSQDSKHDSPSAKRVKTHRDIKWTQPMDDHLWFTYMQYLADPRVTPFKMLPGTCPPLGVCSRVASKARRTWSQHRATPGLDTVMASDYIREGSPDTIRPDVKQPQWPRSDSATRRRLRTLCKRKPSLSAHYQRLLRTRSPSPFLSSSSAPSRASEPPPQQQPASFSSRDLNVSLVAATAPSMQPEGPLAQLAADHDPRPQSSSSSKRDSRPADWFARIGRSQAHQKSLSLQSGLNLEAPSPRRPASLASPFDVDRTHLLQSMGATKSLGRTEFDRKNGHGKTPSLDAPVELNGAPTFPRSLKRRFRGDEEKPRRPAIQDVFGDSATEDNIIIARNRGFSTGAVRASDNLSRLFTPPAPARTPPPTLSVPSADFQMPEAPAMPSADPFSDAIPLGCRSAPRRLAEPIPRLGSPFVENASSDRQFNTFPRSYVPSASNPQPFQQRLRQLAAQDSMSIQ